MRLKVREKVAHPWVHKQPIATRILACLEANHNVIPLLKDKPSWRSEKLRPGKKRVENSVEKPLLDTR